MGGNFHILETARIVGDLIFLFLGTVPIVYATLLLVFGRKVKTGEPFLRPKAS